MNANREVEMFQRKWRLMILPALFATCVPLQGCVVIVTERPRPSQRPWPTTVLDATVADIDVIGAIDPRSGGR